MFSTYIITNLVNGKLYLGKTKDIHKRWNEHKKIARGGKNTYDRNYQYLHAAISKYGVQNFTITTLNSYELEQQALDEEIRLITQYKIDGYQLYNLTDGGEGISGWKPSDETKLKLSIANNGKTLSDETKHKMSIAKTGFHHSNETKHKMSNSKLGANNHWLNIHHSEESKQKMSVKKSGENHPLAKLSWNMVNLIRKLSTQGVSDKEISKQLGINKNAVGKIRRNERWKQS